ncbi:MAG: hypothetical protein AB2L13_10625 [Spirochaetota bacterium]
MNSARIPGHEFRPTPSRLCEIEAQARRVAELDRRERVLLSVAAELGSWEAHSPFYGRVTWDFGANGLKVQDSTGEAG